MQSLGDYTLSAFMKSDLSKEFDNVVGKTTRRTELAKRRSKKSTRSEDDSDIAKYFKDSLVFSSKDTNADKENSPASNIELDAIPESPTKHRAFSMTGQSVPKKARIAATSKLTRKNSSQQVCQIRGAEESTVSSINSLEAIRSSDDHENSVNSIVKNSAVTAICTNEKSRNETTTNSSIVISSAICTPDRCKLASWGLPLTILRKYEARGVTSMFPWQVECLSNRELLEKNRNLVYSAPTSAGKTLVAEILVIKTIMERRKKVIFILPFVSVVREKMYYFQDLLTDSGFRVEGFMGGCSPAGGFAATDVAIATIEKANSLLNQLMEDSNLENLGAVVIDELHLIGDPYRGYLLELLLTKLKYMNIREELVNVQLIGMSATLPNLGLLAKWLDAELYKTDFRPVPLNELCKIGTTIYDNGMKSLRNLPAIPSLAADSDNILQLCIETISDGHSVLIFCPTKNWCEKLAHQIANTFCKLGRENTRIGRTLREQLCAEAIVETLEQLKRTPAGLDDVLKSTVSFGTAFHHAGLTMDERDVVEGAFRSGALRVLTATSTLSSGVNLPARRVIIRSLMFHGKPLDTLTYRQMIGRAGRMGKDTAGESILICKSNEKRAATTLLTSNLPSIESCLEGSEPLIRALLEAVASEVAYTAGDIDLYVRCTLVSLTCEELIAESTREAIKFLIENELFMLQTTNDGDERWIATQLGKACLAASMPPNEGLFLFEELQKARRCFVLDTELHVIYLVTPLNSSNQIGNIDWFVFLDLWKSITESERRVGQLIGVDENFLLSAIRGATRSGKILDIHKRFYTALALHELVREVPLVDVCRKYGCCRGIIQSLQQSAATFAGMVTQFCKKLGWNCMELLIGQFQARLQFGVCRELLDLLRLPMLNGLRARSLYKEGITCVAELAIANVLDVERGLHKALPFESGKEYNGEHEFDAAKRNKMRSVFVTGRDGLTPQDAALILVREARALVQKELGIDDLQWKQRDCSTKMSQCSISSAKGNSNDRPKIGDSVEVISIDNREQSKREIEDSRGNEIKSDEAENNDPGIGEADEKIGKIVSIINNSSQEHFSNDIVDSEYRAAIFSNNTLESMSNGSAVISKDDAIGSKTRETVCVDILDFTSTEKVTDFEEDDVVGSKTRQATGEKYIVEFTNAETPIVPREDITGTEIHEEICQEDVFQFTSTESAIDPKDVIGSKTVEDICADDIFEFTSTASAIEPGNGSKTSEVICEDSFDFTSTGNAIVADHVVGLKICDGHSKEIFEFTGTGQTTTDTKEKLIGSTKTSSTVSPAILLRQSLMKESDSRSPSMFGDSLNLDTQECNILEQNVIDSLNVSLFGDTNISGFVDTQKNITPKNRSSEETRTNRRSGTSSQRRSSLKNSVSRRSPRISELNNKSKSIVWDDDSWNNTNGIIETVNILNTAIISRVADENDRRDFKTPPNGKIRDKKVSSRGSKSDKEDRIYPKNRTTELQKIPFKRKLSETSIEISSPISGLLKNSQTRRLSIDSNKSDSDDVVIPSQSVLLSTRNMKNRTRLKLESLRKSRTPRTTRAKVIEENNDEKSLIRENCSIESVVSTSDEETPVKRGYVLTRTNIISSVDKASVSRKRLLGTTRTSVDETRIKKSASICPSEIKVVNVAANWAKFNQFKRDLVNKKDMALALACETFLKGTISIGTKIVGITGIDGRKKTKKIENCVYGNKKICGVAFSWDGIAVHYISFDNTHELKVPVKERLDLLTDILNTTDLTVHCFSFKETYKILYNCCRIASSCKFLDPKTADWLLDPEHSERSFNALIAEHLTEAQFMLQRTGTHLGWAGPGLNIKSAISSEIRATTEAALTWHLTNTLMMKLEARSSKLLETFREIEMGTLTLLARMELTGLGVNLKSLQELSEVIQHEMSQLEDKAYSLAGRKFNFSSSKSVAQVLGLYKGKKVSTNKAVLEHSGNPISRLVMSWRKLSTTQIKVVFPLLSLAECNSRIYGNCVTNTVTGRVSMHEPNLQSIPRDFNSQDDSFVISVRMAFVPMHGNVILSADYCQLELRILAHFSKEQNLCRILRKKGDVFKNIAARWYNVVEEKIDDTMRQRTKQLCYGMIYGMGVKTLAETLAVTETEAKEFLETFMGAYPGIRPWLTHVVEEARTNGYVTTLMARRRFLPALNSEVSSERSQAERQAVNTMVQGSAADITKKAMVKIDERMRREFPNAPLVLADIPTKRKLRSDGREDLARGGYLVLQIHDELLYEVNATNLQQVETIIKESMEKSCELRVPLPVKLRVGPTWGDLTEIMFENV